MSNSMFDDFDEGYRGYNDENDEIDAPKDFREGLSSEQISSVYRKRKAWSQLAVSVVSEAGAVFARSRSKKQQLTKGFILNSALRCVTSAVIVADEYLNDGKLNGKNNILYTIDTAINAASIGLQLDDYNSTKLTKEYELSKIKKDQINRRHMKKMSFGDLLSPENALLLIKLGVTNTIVPFIGEESVSDDEKIPIIFKTAGKGIWNVFVESLDPQTRLVTTDAVNVTVGVVSVVRRSLIGENLEANLRSTSVGNTIVSSLDELGKTVSMGNPNHNLYGRNRRGRGGDMLIDPSVMAYDREQDLLL